MFVDIPFFPRIDFSVNTFRSWGSTVDGHIRQGLLCFVSRYVESESCAIRVVCVANGNIHIVNVRYYPCIFPLFFDNCIPMMSYYFSCL